MRVEAYLVFEGRCEEAIEVYRRALDARVNVLMRFKDSPDPAAHATLPPGAENKVLHASFQVGDTTIMASDGRAQGGSTLQGRPTFQGISLTITVADDAEAQRRFTALADGGQVQQPLIKTFFSSSFGVLLDRFGVSWMVIVAQ
jgi:PhnB protein